MIITRLLGGIGNQMFQYAAGRRLAYIHKTRLRLDISEFSHYKLREFSLDCFNINAEIVSINKISKLWFKLFPFKRRPAVYYFEKHTQFDPHVLDLPDNTYLSGYWQSEKYFLDIEEIIKREFTPKNLPDKYNMYLLKNINKAESVSIHIRRGDYVSNPQTSAYHGLCSLEYYQKAIQIIRKMVKSPQVFIFSDDIAWAKKNLAIDSPIFYVEHNRGEKDYEDLRLMSACKHNIIANSSFSWWGAWLNKNKNKIVISPRKWFGDPSINTDDLIPPTWIRI